MTAAQAWERIWRTPLLRYVEVEQKMPFPEPENYNAPWRFECALMSFAALELERLQMRRIKFETHQTAVTDALAKGCPVPVEVVADYPELVDRYGGLEAIGVRAKKAEARSHRERRLEARKIEAEITALALEYELTDGHKREELATNLAQLNADLSRVKATA